MQIGDEVLWVPNIDHARDPIPGGFAWEHEILDPRIDKWGVAKPEAVLNAIEIIKRDPNRRKELRASKPVAKYPAVVTAVEGDKVSLDIKSPIGGVTLHYDNVAIDPSGKPGTCHEPV